MVDKNKVKELIQTRLDREGFLECGDDTDWINLTNYLSEDIASTIQYLENEADPEDIFWISEVFEYIAEKTQSREFIAALRRVCEKLPDYVEYLAEDVRDYSNFRESIKSSIDYAESYIRD